MSIDNINNLESASSIRAKLNELITIVNYYSSSQFVGGGDPAPGGGGGDPAPGGGGTEITVYDNEMMPAMYSGTDDVMSACMAASGGYSKTAYMVKGASNTGPGPEVGDMLYQDSGLTTLLPMGRYFGYVDAMMMMNKSIYIGITSSVDSINPC